MGTQRHYALNGITLPLFRSVLVVIDFDWRIILVQEGDGFLLSRHDSCLAQTDVYHFS